MKCISAHRGVAVETPSQEPLRDGRQGILVQLLEAAAHLSPTRGRLRPPLRATVLVADRLPGCHPHHGWTARWSLASNSPQVHAQTLPRDHKTESTSWQRKERPDAQRESGAQTRCATLNHFPPITNGLACVRASLIPDVSAEEPPTTNDPEADPSEQRHGLNVGAMLDSRTAPPRAHPVAQLRPVSTSIAALSVGTRGRPMLGRPPMSMMLSPLAIADRATDVQRPSVRPTTQCARRPLGIVHEVRPDQAPSRAQPNAQGPDLLARQGLVCRRTCSCEPGIATDDGRRLEATTSGLPIARGVPLGVDALRWCPLCTRTARLGLGRRRGWRSNRLG